jgi:hypothetical protein
MILADIKIPVVIMPGVARPLQIGPRVIDIFQADSRRRLEVGPVPEKGLPEGL